MKPIAILAAVAALTALAPAQIGHSRSFLLTDKSAIAILPPEVVCGPTVEDAKWSPDGRHLMVRRRLVSLTPEMVRAAISGTGPGAEPMIEDQVLLWNTATKKSQVLLSLKPNQGRIETVAWLPGTTSMVAELEPARVTGDEAAGVQPGRSILLIPIAGRPRALYMGSPHEQFNLHVSPRHPLIALLSFGFSEPVQESGHATKPAGTVRYIGLDGRPPVAVRFSGNPSQVSWASDGQTLVAKFTTPVQRGSNRVAQDAWVAFSRTSGRAEPIGAVAPAEPAGAELDFEASAAVQGLTGSGGTAPVVSLRSKGKGRPDVAVIATDASAPLLHPSGDAIAFRMQGALMVKLLVRAPREAYAKAKEAAERTVSMSNAKQAALALILMATDHDGTFPSNEAGWQERVLPYIKAESILSGFIYTFKGGPLGDIKDPSVTVLGYWPGPGGQAVAYADGHVRWEPLQP